ncbi:hypothetical protein OG607_22520 [Streptomyces sp. NBC_01537]|uniref:LppU/SCO3897 family protein n=1 Tax=Streptomyces sp. NBC_01537 TaxID=2903896 RepID=UPI0038672F0D
MTSIVHPIANEGNSVSYPPPPQGGYPQQPQQPQWGPPQQQPYPPQGGYAYPPQQPQAPQPYPPQQQQQPWGAPQGPIPQVPTPPQNGDNDSIKKNLIKIVAILAGVGIVWGALEYFDFGEDTAKYAAVGDCMKNEGSAISPDMTIVDCTSSEATYKVAAVHKNTRDTSLCAEGTIGYSETSTTGRKGHRKTSTVTLCLTAVK